MRCPNCDGTWSSNDFYHFDGEYVWFICMVCDEKYHGEVILVQEEQS